MTQLASPGQVTGADPVAGGFVRTWLAIGGTALLLLAGLARWSLAAS